MPQFLLDANVLIAAKNLLPIDLFPSFWQKISSLAVSGAIHSIVKVKEEILKGNSTDPLVAWCNSLPETFFISFDASMAPAYGRVIAWSQSQTVFTSAALSEFARLDVADAFLVASAATLNCVIVTNEISDPQCKKRVKIPDAANALGVKCVSLNDVLRELGVTI